VFVDDHNNQFSIAITNPNKFFAVGSFTFRRGNLAKPPTKQFFTILDFANRERYFPSTTHYGNQIIDVFTSHADTSLQPSITFSPVSPSDYFPNKYSLSDSPLSSPPLPLITESFCCIKSNTINIEQFNMT
jgi:hypothetical protein